MLDAIDGRIGDIIERASRHHHRRRLAQVGWEQALRGDGGRWAAGAPPGDGNRIDIYIDGAAALPAIAAGSSCRAPDFRLFIVLPQRPTNGNDTTRGRLGVLRKRSGNYSQDHTRQRRRRLAPVISVDSFDNQNSPAATVPRLAGGVGFGHLV